MTDWQHRVMIERVELAQKLDKLDTYLINNTDGLLSDQRAAMAEYLTILELRITGF